MSAQEFILDLLRFSPHMGRPGIALQEYALTLLRREVADLQAMGGDDPVSFYSAIHYGEQVSRRGCYGEHFRYTQYVFTSRELWEGRLAHLECWIAEPGRAGQQAVRAVLDMDRQHDIDVAEELLLHLWGGCWLHDLEGAARMLWNVSRAKVGDLDLETASMEMDMAQLQSSLGAGFVQAAAATTRHRGIPSPTYERFAGRQFGLTDMRLLRSRDALNRVQFYLDVIHNESIVYHGLRYLLQEASLLENPYMRTLERFIEDNERRCTDCEQTLRFGPRCPQFASLVSAIRHEQWDEAKAMLDCDMEYRLMRPGYIDNMARKLIQEKVHDTTELEDAWEQRMSPGQRFATEFGWLTRDSESIEEAREVIRGMNRPY